MLLDVKLQISTAVKLMKQNHICIQLKNVADTQKTMCRWLLERELKELVSSRWQRVSPKK